MANLAILTVLVAIVGATLGDESLLAFNVNPDGTYSFAAGGNHDFNLTSGDAFLQANKHPYSSQDGTLKLHRQNTIQDEDALGKYEGRSYMYMAGNVAVNYQVMVYEGGRFARFRQVFPQGVQNTNVSSHDGVVSGFPNFKTNSGTQNLGYINTFDNFCGYSYLISNFTANKFLRGGQRAGPFVVFDKHGNVMVLSAFSNFMAHNMMFNVTSYQLHFGIMGGVTSVPSGYEIDTILYFGNAGINQAIEGWGEVITKRFGKTTEYRDTDFTINYLGYWTDNGAFYYYQKERNKTYEETVLDVVKYATTAGIPYRYLQYDSWWYFKSVGDGVKNWTAKSDVFPHGMEYLFQQHGLPVAAHNRYWASDTDYAKKNGGKYNFLVEKTKSIPNDEVTHTDIHLGRNWLLQMGHGAAKHRMTIQYCMALSRHMLQSVEIPSVTQARVSEDYQPGNNQWKIGITSMFANALNLAPYKDTFWTTAHQNGSEYSTDEKYPALQAAIATLSTGPVGPSDSIGMTSNIIHQSCRSDGLILKPSRPITTVDRHILDIAFPSLLTSASANADAEVFSTFTDIMYSSGSLRHGMILVTDLTTAFQAYPNMMYLDSQGYYAAYNGHPGNDLNVYAINPMKSHTIPKCGRSDFQLWYFAPTFTLGNRRVAVLGERGKWVPVSPQRILSVEVMENSVIVHVEGVPGENIQFGFYDSSDVDDNNVVFVNCCFGNSSKMKLIYSSEFSQSCMNE